MKRRMSHQSLCNPLWSATSTNKIEEIVALLGISDLNQKLCEKKIDSKVLTLSLLGEYTPLWDFQKIWQVQNHQSSKLLYHQSTNYLVSYPGGKQCKHEQQL